MQELEFLETSGIVIATSNLPKNLDRALWRRFDEVIQFPSPTVSEVKRYSIGILAKFGLKPSPSLLREVSTAKTFADAERMVECEARRLALERVIKQ